MPDETSETLESSAIVTYRYLRLAIVVVTISLLCSILFEVIRAGCAVESISGYYYTPVRTVFAGGLIAIGVSLIAIKEDTPAKDSLLNLAGALAPIVAFVPTTFPGGACESTVGGGFDTGPGIVNNVAAYATAGTISVVIGVVAAWKHNKKVGRVDKAARVVLVFAGVMLLAGLAWYYVWNRNFLDHAHFISAIGLFGVVGVVMVLNAIDRKNSASMRVFYACTAASMLVGALAVGSIKLWILEDWQHLVLWLELVELAPFLLYWVVQTVQHWDEGIEGVPRTAPTLPGIAA